VPQPRITLSVRPVLLAATLVCAGVALTACAGGSSNASPAASQAGSASADQQNRQRQFPGATGELAAISGSTLQVQGTSSQTAVTFTRATKISDTVAATSAAVKVGVCVDARPARTDTSTSAPATGESTNVAAATVVVTQPVNGECAAGAGGFGGARPNGSTGAAFTPPSGGARPSGAPSGGQQRRGGFGADGKVVSVSGSGFVVASVRFSPAVSAAASASPTTTEATVTTSASTTYSETVTATASALKVGTCVTALGKADDTGAIAATAISVRAKTDGTCGFAGGGPNG